MAIPCGPLVSSSLAVIGSLAGKRRRSPRIPAKLELIETGLSHKPVKLTLSSSPSLVLLRMIYAEVRKFRFTLLTSGFAEFRRLGCRLRLAGMAPGRPLQDR